MKVIIIGAGIAGPVLAMLLQHKGFEPVIYERHAEYPKGGLVMQLSGQVFKVLNIIGLAEEAIAISLPMERTLQTSAVTGKVLMDSNVQAKIRETTGWPMCTVIRTTYSRFLLENTEKRGIPIHLGKKCVGVKQNDDKVTAVFEDGSTVEGDLLVGCDGIHSKVRDALFGKTPAEYTGLSAIGGFTAYSEALRPGATDPVTAFQISGDGCHFICAPTREKKYVWVVNLCEEQPMVEDWRTTGTKPWSDVLVSLPPVEWGGDGAKVVASTTECVRFGLYLRPIPPVWHKGRAVLLGDAAHPTTPFLGQGANQSTEDIYHLVRLLVKHQPLTNEDFETALTEYTAIRLPRVAKAVEQSKREGESRKARGKEAVMKREEMLSKGLESDTWKIILEMVQGPFTGESEI